MVLQAVLFLAPALLLVLPLLARRYPGERLLIAVHRKAPPRWPRARSSAPTRENPMLVAARGGLLLARALAVRPPPALSAAS